MDNIKVAGEVEISIDIYLSVLVPVQKQSKNFSKCYLSFIVVLFIWKKLSPSIFCHMFLYLKNLFHLWLAHVYLNIVLHI